MTAAGPTDPPDGRPPARPVHEPFLRRLRRAGRDPSTFKVGRARTWFYLGVAALAFLALVPVFAPEWSTVTERAATLLSLVFLVAAIGLWLGMRGRAFVVASALVLALYASTFWTRLAFDLQDFFVLAVLVSFGVFALAGFNLVFVLEEVVHDAHVRIHLGSRLWEFAPTVLCMALAVGLPLWGEYGDAPSLPALWVASVAGALLLLFWWSVAWANGLRSAAVLRELHLFVLGALAATALADGFRALDAAVDLPRLVPSLLAYLVLIGTWVYASYTTLQRTHFLLRGANWRPWVSILLGASFAILAHSQVLVATAGSQAVADLVDLRVTWLVAGVWLGIAFYAARGLHRVFVFVQAAGLGGRTQAFAHGAELVVGSLAGTERVLEGAAAAMFRRLDTVLPGEAQPPRLPPPEELPPTAAQALAGEPRNPES